MAAEHLRRHARVLMISQHPYPANPTLRRNVDYLAELGVELDVFCTRDPTVASDPATPPGVRIRTMRMAHRRHGPMRYIAEYFGFFLWALPQVWMLALRHRYTAVQVDNVPDFLVFLAWPARLRGARVVFFMFELMPELTSSRMKMSPRHFVVRVLRVIERMAVGWADRVIVVNEPCRRLLAGRTPTADGAVVVTNAMPRSSWPMLEPETTATAPTLITHTTLVERYGVQVAIRAVALLRKDWPDLVLEVLGEGEYLPTLQRLSQELGVQDRVRFIGFRPWAEAMTRVRQATLGLVAVTADGYGELLLPNKLLDYIILGVPAVCSRLTTIAEYFPPDTMAYFEPGDEVDLARQVTRLLQDPRGAARQADLARLAFQRISWETVSQSYLEALGMCA